MARHTCGCPTRVGPPPLGRRPVHRANPGSEFSNRETAVDQGQEMHRVAKNAQTDHFGASFAAYWQTSGAPRCWTFCPPTALSQRFPMDDDGSVQDGITVAPAIMCSHGGT